MLKRKTIYCDGEYVSFPNLVWLDENTLACFFRHAKDRQKAGGRPTHIDPTAKDGFIVSKDGGESFETAFHVVLDDEMSEQDPCATALSNGRVLMTCFRWQFAPEGQGATRWGDALFKRYGRTRKAREDEPHGFDTFNIGFSVSISDDHGHTWRHTPVLRPEGYVPGSAVRGNIVELPDGALLLPFYGAKEIGCLASTGVMISRDNGEHWRFFSETAFEREKNFLEPCLFRTRSGTLITLMRTQSDFLKPNAAFEATYLNLHVSVSYDNGKTFAPAREIPSILGSNPFHALQLRNGKVFVSYGYRQKPFGIRAKLCDSELSDLESAPEIIICDDAPNGDLGYTHAAELRDGRVLLAYYIADEDGTRRIEGATLKGYDAP
ncbi:MAG: glycoside hydrolase [Treponema sp.]|nr:glycoside hydrolase [Treponema sp.]